VDSTAPNFAPCGFPYPANLIQAFIAGSQLHGAKTDSTDDTDWYGVFVEPPEKIIGLDRDEFFVFTTGGKEGGNGPQDVWRQKEIPPRFILFSRKNSFLPCRGPRFAKIATFSPQEFI
jgi:RNA repair pathway DNA polymerase beta family